METEVINGFLRGYAARFGCLSIPLTSADGTRFREQILPGAFDKVLASNDETLANLAHCDEQAFARRSDGTLRLQQDGRGLLVAIQLPSTSWGAEMRRRVQQGDTPYMSFKFGTRDDAWSVVGGQNIRTIRSVDRLWDVCICPIPAYRDTSVEWRDRDPFNPHAIPSHLDNETRLRWMRLTLAERACA